MAKIQVLVSLDEGDVEWVKEHYPKKGTFTWLFSHTLKNFRQLHQINPDELISEGVKALNLEELQSMEEDEDGTHHA